MITDKDQTFYGLSPGSPGLTGDSDHSFIAPTTVFKIEVASGAATVTDIARFDFREDAEAFVRAWNGEPNPGGPPDA